MCFGPIGLLVSIVAAFNNVQQATRWSFAGIVFGRKDFSVSADTDPKRIPESIGNPPQILSVGRTTKNSAFASAANGDAVRAGQCPRLSEILSETEHKITVGMPRQSFKSVVRIDSLGLQREDIFFDIALSIAVGISDTRDSIAFGEIDPAVRSEFQIHRRIGGVVEHLPLFGFPVSVLVSEDKDFIVFRTNVVVRPKMCMRGDDPDPPLIVNVNSGRRHKCRMFGHERKLHAGQQCLYLWIPFIGRSRTANAKTQKDQHQNNCLFHSIDYEPCEAGV